MCLWNIRKNKIGEVALDLQQLEEEDGGIKKMENLKSLYWILREKNREIVLRQLQWF